MRTEVLYKISDERGYFYLEATLNDNGTLVLYGQDFGRNILGTGKSEYEYWTSFDTENTNKLASVLLGEDLLDALKAFFNNDMMNIEFNELCEKHNIKYSRFVDF